MSKVEIEAAPALFFCSRTEAAAGSGGGRARNRHLLISFFAVFYARCVFSANSVRSSKSHITDSMTMFVYVYMYTFLCTTQHTMITKYTEGGKVNQIYADKERTVERSSKHEQGFQKKIVKKTLQ